MSGVKFEPEIAVDLWAKIQQHKWLLSERLCRDVGFRTACIDFLENMEQALNEYLSYQRRDILNEMGAQSFGREIWDTISDSQPPKQLVKRRIILPLTMEELSRKHGVSPPRTIIFFGPPGTGKTHFVRAMAGILSWWYIEIAPSMLMQDGTEKLGANLRRTMEKARQLQDAVIFIDEFEELAACRNEADRLDKCITNEFLKQVPLFKNESKRLLLVCATNYIRHLDPALLRPGRFDCIIPVGGLAADERKTILDHYLSRINVGHIDLDKLVNETSKFTPADIQYLFEQVAQYAFEQEIGENKDYKVVTEDILQVMAKVRPSLTDEIVEEFEEDSRTYSRA
jgi:SpoVK/Ycf46/Vps4 family AAA+-type ATPase